MFTKDQLTQMIAAQEAHLATLKAALANLDAEAFEAVSIEIVGGEVKNDWKRSFEGATMFQDYTSFVNATMFTNGRNAYKVDVEVTFTGEDNAYCFTHFVSSDYDNDLLKRIKEGVDYYLDAPASYGPYAKCANEEEFSFLTNINNYLQSL